jgi:hypothetical protein
MATIVRPFKLGDRDATRRIFADTAFFGDPLLEAKTITLWRGFIKDKVKLLLFGKRL